MTRAEKPAAKKIGRPRKYESDAKRPTLTFRVRGELYRNLQRRAKAHERSMSEEIERSLEDYYRNQSSYGELARMIGTAISTMETTSGKRWFADEEMRIKTRVVVDTILNVFAVPAINEQNEMELVRRELSRAQAKASMSLDVLGEPKPDLTLVQKKLELLSNLNSTAKQTLDVLELEEGHSDPTKMPKSDPRRAEAEYLRKGPAASGESK